MAEQSVLEANESLQAAVDVLRSRITDTQELYGEVCLLLFFRHGITPTANRLYQLVRKGSMSAPAEALARFWANLREKSRVRIEHPDLPQELADMAGEMVGALWQRSRSQALADFADARTESQAALAASEKQALEAQARADAAAHALFQLQAEFSANLTRLQETEHALAREEAARSAAENQIASAVAQRRELQEALAAARKDFEEQIEQHRGAARDAREQSLADVARATELADRERGRAASLDRELKQVRDAAAIQEQGRQREIGHLQWDNARLGQELGAALGSLAEARAARDLISRQLERGLGQGKDGRGGAPGTDHPARLRGGTGIRMTDVSENRYFQNLRN